MQKKILRGMAGVSLYDYEPSLRIFLEFSLLVLNHIKVHMTALFVYKYLHNLDFTDWFTLRSSIYHTRFDQSTPVLVPRITNKQTF